jgi:hypothetical protein
MGNFCKTLSAANALADGVGVKQKRRLAAGGQALLQNDWGKYD